MNDSFPLGHRLRDHAAFRAPARQMRVPIVIVGGGMAGLNAAWYLDKRGFRDFVLLEMEREAGGNSRWGENEISKFPWAAHYVPVPAKGESFARELFEELGVFRDGKWDERVLCFDPQERLFINGHWQEGIEPEDGASPRGSRAVSPLPGKDQRVSRHGPVHRPHGARRKALAARSNVDGRLAGPAGLRFRASALVHQLCLPRRLRRSRERHVGVGRHPIFRLARAGGKRPADLARRQRLDRRAVNREAQSAICEPATRCIALRAPATKFAFSPNKPSTSPTPSSGPRPTFLASYIIEGAPRAEGFQYSPWLTANLTLDRIPEQNNPEPAWDNVIYDSPTLGYVNATHMSLATHIDKTVWTFYWSLAEHAPNDARRLLLAHDWNYWKEAILNDLARAHPDIRQCVAHIDIMRIGHAMARPSPGFMFSEARTRWLKPLGNIFFANSDLSGFSIFEEAQYRGVEAAKGAARLIGRA